MTVSMVIALRGTRTIQKVVERLVTRLLLTATVVFLLTPVHSASAAGDGELLMPRFYELQNELLASQIFESYKRSRHARDEWDAKLRKLSDSAARMFYMRHNREHPHELYQGVSEVIDAGCECPTLLFMRGMALDRLHRTEDAIRIYSRGLRLVADGDIVHPGVLAQVAARHGHLVVTHGPGEQAEASFAVASSAFVAMIRQTPGDTLNQRLSIAALSSTLYELTRGGQCPHKERFLHQLMDNLDAVDHVQPCTLDTIRGLTEYALAWNARGPDFAATVTADGWKSFAHHLVRSREYLKRAYQADRSRPEAPTRMIAIVAAGHGEAQDTKDLWFARACEAQVDWWEAYAAYLTYLRPRWGGSHKAMIEFAQRCLDTGRFDTDIPHRVVVAVRLILEDFDGNHAVIAQMNLFPMLKAALDGLIAHPAQHARRDYYSAALLIGAWASGDYAVGASLPRLRYSPGVDDAFADLLARRDVVTEEVVLYASESANAVRQAEVQFQEGRYDDAATTLQPLLESANGALKNALNSRLVAARQMALYERGDWVNLTFDAGLPGWRSLKDSWHRNRKDNGVIHMTHYFAEPLLVSDLCVGTRWELEASINMTAVSNLKWIDAGFVFGIADKHNPETCLQLTAVPHSKSIAWGYRGAPKESLILSPLPDAESKMFKFHLATWDNLAGLTVNGHRAFFCQLPARSLKEQFGLAASFDWPSGEVVFSQVRIRKLAERPDYLPVVTE